MRGKMKRKTKIVCKKQAKPKKYEAKQEKPYSVGLLMDVVLAFRHYSKYFAALTL